jgi:Sulfotransferase family/Glycosyl transferase family 2
MLSICAVIAVHNGEKTLDRVLQHFEQNGIEVHVIDHGSNDKTPQIIKSRFGAPIVGHTYLKFDGIFRLREQLQLKAGVVQSLMHDWIIHSDADEIMESSVSGESLRGMIERQHLGGFDVIDCDEFVFVPPEIRESEDFVSELQTYYHFSPPSRRLHRAQSRRGQILDWSVTGGHELNLEGRSIAPEKIRLRHYLGVSFDHLNSQYLARVFDGEELTNGWHRKRVPTTPNFIVKPEPSRLLNIKKDGFTTRCPEVNHLLFYQPHQYVPPSVLPKVREREPFPCIVGVGRSGTTLLRLMVDAHPDIVITPETHWLRPVLQHLRNSPGDFSEARNLMLAEPSWRDLTLTHAELDEIWSVHSEKLPFDSIRRIYMAYAQKHEVKRVGDKTPLHGLAMYQIASCLPEAHFIHIVRDGRDVAISYRDMWFGPGRDARTAALFWMWQIREIRQQAQFVPNYMEVRYEELVRNPEDVLRCIGEFINLPYHEKQLRAHVTANDRLAELQDVVRHGKTISAEHRRSAHALVTREPDVSRVGRWRTEMNDEEISAFERVAGDMLADLGYLRARG